MIVTHLGWFGDCFQEVQHLKSAHILLAMNNEALHSTNDKETSVPPAKTIRDEVKKYLWRSLLLVVPLLGGMAAGASYFFNMVTDMKAESEAVKRVEKKLLQIEEKTVKLESTLEQALKTYVEAKTRAEDIEKMFQDMKTMHREMAGQDKDLKDRMVRLKEADEALKAASLVVENTNKMAESLKTTAAFTQSQGKQEEIARALLGDRSFLDKVIAGLQPHLPTPVTGPSGTGYRAEYDGKDGVTFHSAPNQKSEAGVVYRTGWEGPQFTRLSTSVYWNGGTPRCHVRFQGWLPERAFDKALLPAPGRSTQVETAQNAADEARTLHHQAAANSPMLAVFLPGVPVFTTGQRQAGWIEVTFDGWIAIETDKSGRRLVAPIAN